SGTIQAYDPLTGLKKNTFAGHPSTLQSAAFATGDKRLATGHWNGMVVLWSWNAATDDLRFRGHSAPVGDVAFNPSADRLISCDREGHVFVWSANESQDRKVTRYSKAPNDSNYVLSPDGRRAVRQRSGFVHVVDATTQRNCLPPVPHQAYLAPF